MRLASQIAASPVAPSMSPIGSGVSSPGIEPYEKLSIIVSVLVALNLMSVIATSDVIPQNFMVELAGLVMV